MAIIPKGGGGKPEEEKTVTAGTSTKVVTPLEGKTIKKVTVNPTPSQSKTVTPSTSQQTVSPDSGKLLSKVIVKAIEDVTPEVTAQTPMISQILSNLGFTADSASGTNKQKLQTNNANLAKISDYLPHGAYVWKKLTAQGGDFVDFVVSDQSAAYTDGGTQDGYWYEKVVEGINIDEYENFKTETVTLASQSIDLPHTYGEVPDLVIIEADPTLIAKDTTGEKGFVFAIRGAGMRYKAKPTEAEKAIFKSVGLKKYYYSSAHKITTVDSNYIVVYADRITLSSSFSDTFKNYFKDGLEYKITMAKAKVYSL